MEASTRPGWAVPAWPTVVVRSSTSTPSASPSERASALTARPCMPVTATRSTCSAARPDGLQGRLPRLGSEGDVPGLAEPLLPHLGPLVTRRPPPVEELVGHRGPAQVLGHHPGARGVVADHDGGGAVTPGRFVGRGGEAVTSVGQHHQGRPGARGRQAGAQRPHARSQRPTEVEGGDMARLAQGGVDGGGVGLVQVGRGWPWRTRGRRAPPPGRTGGPGGPPPRPWWWCPRRRRPPTGSPCRHPSRRAGHGRPLQAAIGDVPGDADDASHLSCGPFGSWWWRTVDSGGTCGYVGRCCPLAVPRSPGCLRAAGG